MRMIKPLAISVALLAAMLSLPASATEHAARSGNGLTEIPDQQLALMRGRYTVGNNAVAWFGVSMVSTWQTASGQTLQSTLQFGMNFADSDRPTITFTPTVSITDVDAPLPPTGGHTRSIDASGLANVSGLTQSVQVAGDGNLASNVTQLNVREGTTAPSPDLAGVSPGQVSSRQGTAVATAGFDDGAARVLLQIEGQGAVEQWIRSGSLGQSVQLTSDNQQVTNRLEINMVRQALASNAQLAQNVARAINMTRGIGLGN